MPTAHGKLIAFCLQRGAATVRDYPKRSAWPVEFTGLPGSPLRQALAVIGVGKLIVPFLSRNGRNWTITMECPPQQKVIAPGYIPCWGADGRRAMVISSELIARAQEQSLWGFANEILYDMCHRKPLHTNGMEIAGKMLLIGRSYAAAIERGAGSPRSGDDFYIHDVVSEMLRVGAELDARIAAFSEQKVNRALLGPVVETHGFLTRVFNSISGKNKRSLASKYLHFHAPNIFFLYDSRAASGVAAHARCRQPAHVRCRLTAASQANRTPHPGTPSEPA